MKNIVIISISLVYATSSLAMEADSGDPIAPYEDINDVPFSHLPLEMKLCIINNLNESQLRKLITVSKDLRTILSNGKKFVCKSCNLIYYTQVAFEEHLNRHRCSHGCAFFENLESLQIHENNVWQWMLRCS